MSDTKSIHEIEPGRWAFYCKLCGKRRTRRVFDYQSQAIEHWREHRETQMHATALLLAAREGRARQKAEADLLARIFED